MCARGVGVWNCKDKPVQHRKGGHPGVETYAENLANVTVGDVVVGAEAVGEVHLNVQRLRQLDRRRNDVGDIDLVQVPEIVKTGAKRVSGKPSESGRAGEQAA